MAHVEIEPAAVEKKAAVARRLVVIAVVQIDQAELLLLEDVIAHARRDGGKPERFGSHAAILGFQTGEPLHASSVLGFWAPATKEFLTRGHRLASIHEGRLGRSFMRGLFLFASIFFAFASRAAEVHPSPPVDFAHLPWKDGEALTYLVSWDTLRGGAGHLHRARQRATTGNSSSTSPRAAWSTTSIPSPAISGAILGPAAVALGRVRRISLRAEAARSRSGRGSITRKHQGTREDVGRGQDEDLSHRRGLPSMTSARCFTTCAPARGSRATSARSTSTKAIRKSRREAECQARETRAFGTWPAQPLLRISVLPTEGTHHRGHLTLWMTDDARRLPLHAELEFVRHVRHRFDEPEVGRLTRDWTFRIGSLTILTI